MTLKKIVVLGTGGTIAGLSMNSSSNDNLNYAAAQVGVADLLAGLPNPADCLVHTEQVAQIDSKDMDAAVWHPLAQRCQYWLAQSDVQALLITHGTDTLEETAYFLQHLLQPSKAVVLTCAMRPANALAPDGPQNLRDALAVAAHPQACGVLVVCAGTVHTARDVHKGHTYRLDAFGSGEAGPLGYIEEGQLRQLREWPPVQKPLLDAAQLPAPADWPRVEIATSHAGAQPGLIEALTTQGVQGLVIAGTGNGRVHAALLPALRQAQVAGVRVVVATRCANPHVVLPSAADAAPEFADAGGLSPIKARIALMLDLMAAHV